MLPQNWYHKPPYGTSLDAANPLVEGLAGAWLLNEGTGPPATYGAAKGLATANSMTWAPAPVRGIALYGSGANNPVQFTVADGSPLDITGTAISYGGWIYPTVSNQNHWILGRSAGASGNTIQYGVALSKNGTGQLLIQMRAGASGYSAHTVISTPWLVNAWNLVIVTYDGAAIRGYLNGKLVCSVAQTGSIIRVSGANLCLGSNGNGFGYVTGIDGYLDAAFAWSRVLSAPEVEALYERPYQMWSERIPELIQVDLAPAIYSATPAVIPSNHPGQVAISLHGFGLGWSGGTTLTASGAGLIKASQSITDANDGIIYVETGSATGTGTISDGTYSIPLVVATPQLSASPAVVGATASTTVTLTSTAAVWPTGSQPGLFTVAGIPGASLSNIVVQSANSATATLATGTTQAGGILTITDTSTSTTATLTVAQAYAGSMHCASRVLLEHTGGTIGQLSGQSAGAFGFCLEVGSWGQINLASGVKVQAWGNGSGGYTLHPETQTLAVTIPGTNTNLTATIPIQLGIGYDLVAVATGGVCTLYMNGLQYAQQLSFGNFAAISEIEIGSDPGIVQATGLTASTDYYVSDLRVWSGYAPSGAELANLANRSITPCQTSTPASLWLPLGGGVGVPSGADPWLLDFTGNANTFSVAGGSLSNATYAAPIQFANPITVVAEATKWGLLTFKAAYTSRAANGEHPLGIVAGINGTPTVNRNGVSAQIAPATYLPTTLDHSIVACQPLFGLLQQVAILDGGEGYASAPAASAAGSTFGTVLMAVGATSYNVPTPGSGWTQPPTITFNTPAGGTAATGYGIWLNGQLWDIVIVTGGTNYASTVTITVGSGSATATYVGTITGGVLQVGRASITGSIVIPNPGSGYPVPPTITVPAPTGSPGTSGPLGNITAQAFAVIGDANAPSPGGIRAVFPLAGGLPGCGSGYTAGTLNGLTVSGGTGSGGGANVTANISQYVAQISVTVGGNYNSLPAINVTGGSPTRAPVVRGMMSGPLAGDVLTYSAPPNWLTVYPFQTSNLLGTMPAVTNAPMSNWVGQWEGDVGTVKSCFTRPFTLRPGLNMGQQPIVPSAATFLYRNMLRQGWTWVPDTGSGVITYSTADGSTPSAWTLPTSTVLRLSFYNPNNGNTVDGTGLAAYEGQFSLRYDEPNPNTPQANAVRLGTVLYPANFTAITAVPQSGDASPVAVPSGNITVTSQTVLAGTLTNGSAVVTGLSSVAALGVGQAVTGSNVPAGTVILSINAGASSVTLSQAATAGGTVNLTFAAGCITAVSLAGMTFGSALGPYQAAVITANGGGGSGFAAVVEVHGGVPTAVDVICAGTGYTSAPTMAIAGAALSGSAITSVWNFQLIADPTAWSPAMALYCANSLGVWTMGNPSVLAPNASTGQPNLTFHRSNQFATNEDIKSLLLNGKTSCPIIMRRDDVTMSSSPGPINLALPTDIGPTPSGGSWMQMTNQRLTMAAFPTARFVNTDTAKGSVASGGDGTYNWSPSTKCYSHQAFATSLDAPVTPVSCTLTNGSPVISTAAAPGIMAGASVSGTGIPAGTYIAYFGMQVVGNCTANSSLITGLPTTSGIQMGMPVSGFATSGSIPVGLTVTGVNPSANTITLSGNASGTGTVSLNIGAQAYPINSPTLPLLITLGGPTGALVNATATGTQSLSFQNPAFVPLVPPAGAGIGADDGYFAQNSFGSYNYVVFELVSTQPHGFRTGDNIGLWGDVTIPYTNTVQTGTGRRAAWNVTGTLTNGSAVVTNLTNANLYQPGSPVTGTGIPNGTTIASVQSATQFTLSQAATANGSQTLLISAWSPGSGTGTIAYVTGPYTVVCWANIGGGSGVSPQPNGPQRVNTSATTAPISLASTAYPNGWIGTLEVPPQNSSEPWEAGFAMAGELGTAANWINFSANSGDAAVALIAQKRAANASPGNDVFLHNANETWNVLYISTTFLCGVSTLISYAQSGSVMGYAPAPMPLLLAQYPADALLAAHFADVFTSALIAAMPPGQTCNVHRLLNGWWGGLAANGLAYAVNRAELVNAMQWGTGPSQLVVAPYMDTPTDWPLVVAYSPPGSPVAGCQSWPIPMIHDWFRGWNAYGQNNHYLWGAFGTLCATFGQPLQGLTVSASGTLGQITAGQYYIYNTFVDSLGRETTVGLSQSGQLTVTSGQKVNVTMPAWPPWAAAMNVYISALGAAAGAAPVSYATIPRSSYGYGQIAPGTSFAIGSFPNAGSPPTTNLAAANTAVLPGMACYEGGLERIFPSTVPFYQSLAQDAFAHPAGADGVAGWYMAMNQGAPTVAGARPISANYYQFAVTYNSPPSYWQIVTGASQPAGSGASNKYGMIQGGLPADAHFHAQGNASTYAAGLRAIIAAYEATTPVPATGAGRYTLVGPPVAIAGLPAQFAIVPDCPIASDSVSFFDGGAGGTFSATLQFSGSGAYQTFTYTPPSTGTFTITAVSAAGNSIWNSPFTLKAVRTTATGYALSGPSSVEANVAALFVVSPLAAVASDTVTPSDGGHGGVFSPTSLSFSNTSQPQAFTYTNSTAGTYPISISSSAGGPASYSPSSLTVRPVGFSIAGPTNVLVGIASTYTVTPDFSTTDTVSFSDGNAGGTFNPTSLSWASSSAAKTFTYTPAAVGPHAVVATSAAGGLVAGSPLAIGSGYTVSPPAGQIHPGVPNPPPSPVTGPGAVATPTVVATSSTAAKVYTGARGQTLSIQNTGSVTVWLGGPAVAANAGIELAAGATWPPASGYGETWPLYTCDWWAVSATAGQLTVTVSQATQVAPFYLN